MVGVQYPFDAIDADLAHVIEHGPGAGVDQESGVAIDEKIDVTGVIETEEVLADAGQLIGHDSSTSADWLTGPANPSAAPLRAACAARPARGSARPDQLRAGSAPQKWRRRDR